MGRGDCNGLNNRGIFQKLDISPAIHHDQLLLHTHQQLWVPPEELEILWTIGLKYVFTCAGASPKGHWTQKCLLLYSIQ